MQGPQRAHQLCGCASGSGSRAGVGIVYASVCVYACACTRASCALDLDRHSGREQPLLAWRGVSPERDEAFALRALKATAQWHLARAAARFPRLQDLRQRRRPAREHPLVHQTRVVAARVQIFVFHTQALGVVHAEDQGALRVALDGEGALE